MQDKRFCFCRVFQRVFFHLWLKMWLFCLPGLRWAVLDTDWCHFAVLNSAFPILPSSSSVSGASLVPMKTIFVPISAPPSLANAETQGSCTKPNQTLQIRPTIQIFDFFFNFFLFFPPFLHFAGGFFLLRGGRWGLQKGERLGAILWQDLCHLHPLERGNNVTCVPCKCCLCSPLEQALD